MPSPTSRVTVLAGSAPAATRAVVDALHRAEPGLIAIRHDLSRLADGVIHRLVLTGDEVLEDATVRLAHGCVSCTLRLDVLPTLARLARSHPGTDLVLALPPTVEPEGVALACAISTVDGHPLSHWVTLDTFTTVVDGQTFPADLDTDEDLAERGLAAGNEDTRGVAEVLLRQVEYADALVVVPDPDGGAYETGRLTALLRSLNPWADVQDRKSVV